MSFLYTLSNIVIPYSLLSYATLKRSAEGLSPQYGKWLVLFLLTFIFNGLVLFKSNFIMFVDLALKVSLFFLPQPLNEKIENEINHLHLEGVIQTFRCKGINTLFRLHSKVTLFIVQKLREEQGQQFKEGLIECLNSSKQEPSIEVKSKVKELEHTAVNCTIITPTSIAAVETKLSFLQQKKEELEKKIEDERKNSQPKYQAQRQSSAPQKDKQKSKPKVNHNFVTNTMYKTVQTGFKNRPAGDLEESESMKNIRQSSEYLPDDFEEENTEKPRPSPVRQSRLIDSKISEIRRPAAKNEETGITRRNTDIERLNIDKIIASRQRSLSPDTQSIRDQAQILQKLDLSVSEYSDLFDDEERDEDIDEDEGYVKQVCKVEAIVEIGSAPNARLEIYNLELYSNGDLRIVSLYDREFEKHHLVSMKKVVNNYYELTLSGGSVNKRKIKFRGQHQPFMKYVSPN